MSLVRALLSRKGNTGQVSPEKDKFKSVSFSPEKSIDPFGLFDLSTASSKNDSTRIVSKVVTEKVVILEEGQIAFSEVSYKSYSEEPEVEPDERAEKLRINIIKSCSQSDIFQGNAPSMPSLKLNLSDLEYHEPVRDRDKNWIIQSQRTVLNPIVEEIYDDNHLALGRYPSKKPCPLQWSPVHQKLVRKQRLLRKSYLVSETRCIVSVYGIGVTGRLIATGPRIIILECLSIWNSELFVKHLTVQDLRNLLMCADDKSLMKPGNKKAAIEYLLKHLYFKYTVIAESIPGMVRLTFNINLLILPPYEFLAVASLNS